MRTKAELRCETFSQISAPSNDSACFSLSIGYTFGVDTGLKRRGHRNEPSAGTILDSTPRKKCRFCKGLFTPNPKQARHDFCQPSCRKDFYKYGAFPAAKFKADIEKRVAKRIAAEIAPLRARVEALEHLGRRTHSILPENWIDPETGFARIPKRNGGGA